MSELMPIVIRELFDPLLFEHLDDPTGGSYDVDFEGHTLSWRYRDGIMWSAYSRWSNTDAWVFYVEVGINFDDPHRLFLTFEFICHPGLQDELVPHLSMHLISTPAEWAAIKNGLIVLWIDRGHQIEQDDDQYASEQDTDTS